MAALLPSSKLFTCRPKALRNFSTPRKLSNLQVPLAAAISKSSASLGSYVSLSKSHPSSTAAKAAALKSTDFSNQAMTSISSMDYKAIIQPIPARPSVPNTSSSPPVATDSLEMAIQRWFRRLLTKRDYMHVHAASNAAFLIGGLALEFITNAQWLTGDRAMPWYPTHAYEMLLMQLVIAISAGTGLGLTMTARKGAEQTVFAAYGIQVLQNVIVTLWMAPFLPECMRDCRAAEMAFGAFSIVTSIAALVKLDAGKNEIMAGRNKQQGGSPATGSKAGSLQDLAYWFPNLPGPAFTILSGMMQMHGGHQWCDAFSAAHPEYLAATLHIILTTTLAGHCGMFAVTLRDKKLIGQGAEMVIAGTSNIMSLAYVVLLCVEYPFLLTHALLV